MSPAKALDLLIEGNRRFVAGERVERPDDRARRAEIARGQQPFAVIVGCADSRVPPELLFGRGLGELFVIRNAGNTADVAAMGSLEYAIAELRVPLIVVLGHERCGAVRAAVEMVQSNADFPAGIGEMLEPIVPAALEARGEVGNRDVDAMVDAAVRGNVRRVVARLRFSRPLLAEPQSTGRLWVVGARYDLDEGRVDFFEAA